jgi:serine/threonine protein kinase
MVYLAQDVKLGRPVALKIPRFEPGDDPLYLLRFAREARALVKVGHPNVCRLYDTETLTCTINTRQGETVDIPFAAMEYIEGLPLSDTIATKRRFLPTEAVQIVETLARAMAFVHGKGIIHRDLKPGNILRDRFGKLIIIDFGIARSPAEDLTRLTSAGQTLGTPAYMSPEQAAASPGVGPASDIYSLGVILYELLTGQVPVHPHHDSLPTYLDRVQHEQPARPSTLVSALDPALDEVCTKALAKKPQDRFASMDEFANTLADAAFSATQAPAVPASPPAATPRPSPDTPPLHVAGPAKKPPKKAWRRWVETVAHARRTVRRWRGHHPNGDTSSPRARRLALLGLGAVAALMCVGLCWNLLRTPTGHISITLTNADAEALQLIDVTVDDKPIQASQLADLTLAARTHELSIETTHMDGQGKKYLDPVTTSFDVSPGENAALAVPLSFFGTVQITFRTEDDDPRAKNRVIILVDDVIRRTGEDLRLPIGYHELSITGKGVRPAKRTILIRAGSNIPLVESVTYQDADAIRNLIASSISQMSGRPKAPTTIMTGLWIACPLPTIEQQAVESLQKVAHNSNLAVHRLVRSGNAWKRDVSSLSLATNQGMQFTGKSQDMCDDKPVACVFVFTESWGEVQAGLLQLCRAGKQCYVVIPHGPVKAVPREVIVAAVRYKRVVWVGHGDESDYRGFLASMKSNGSLARLVNESGTKTGHDVRLLLTGQWTVPPLRFVHPTSGNVRVVVIPGRPNVTARIDCLTELKGNTPVWSRPLLLSNPPVIDVSLEGDYVHVLQSSGEAIVLRKETGEVVRPDSGRR